MAKTYTLTPATQTLTITAAPADTNTIVVGGKTYTYQTSLTNVDGNVLIGASAAISLQNLQAAINLGSGAGTLYATAMTANTRVVATSITATTLVVTALTPGEVGNLIASTETHANGSWGGATLTGGAGNVTAWIQNLMSLNQINAEILAELRAATATSPAD